MENSTYTIRAGDDVYGSDGEKVGSVIAVEQDYLVVEKGWFFPTDYYIPLNAVASYEEGRITLNVTKANALEQGWDAEPVLVNTGTTSSVATDAAATDDGDAMAMERTTPAAGTNSLEAGITMTGDTLRLPLYAEELTATRSMRNVAGARIERVVTVEDQSLDLTAAEWRLKLVRRAPSHLADPTGNAVIEEVFIDVPLALEALAVADGMHVGEELVITRELVQRTERVTDMVRREEVHVTETSPGTLLDDVGRTG